MPAPRRSAALIALALTAVSGLRPAVAQQTMDFNQAALIQSLLPTVVNITATLTVPPKNGAAAGSRREFGSGFIIDPTGLIATNNHVIAGAYQLRVMFSDGQTTPAKLVATSATLDVAVIKVETQHPLVAVHWGDSNKLEVGDPVFAIGNALGLGMAVSSGVVSALNRNISDSPLDDFIQTDASINHGNSGGPLFDRAGEVIGMDTALISPTSGSVGLGYAQPSVNVKFITERLIHDGWLKFGWAGAGVVDVTPRLAQAFGLPSATGSIVTALAPGGPAAASGLQIGDVLLRYADRTPQDTRALKRFVVATPIVQTVPVTVLRDGQEKVVQITIKEWPATAAEIRAASTQAAAPTVTIPTDLGLSLSAITDDVRAKYGLDVAQSGVVINGIAAGTDAATSGLSSGDVILRVQNEPVQASQQVQAAIDAARAQHRPYVAALVLQKTQDSPALNWIPLRVSQE